MVPDTNKKCDKWQMVTADAVMDFKNGLNFSADHVGSGIPVVGVGDFGTDFKLPEREFGRVEVGSDLDEAYFLKHQDLLFCRSNGNKALVGRVLYVGSTSEPTSHSGFTIRGRVTSNKFLPLFAAYYFSSSLVKQQILTLGGGTNISNLSQQMLKTVEVPLPPLPEQQKIAAILSTWDRAIELTEKLIAAKQKRKQALMQQLFTGTVRLPGFTDDWVAVRMGDIFKRRSESGTSDLPTLSVTMDRGLIRRDSIDRKMETTLEAEEHLLVRKGDIAYNMMRMWQGASGLALEDGLVSPAYIVLKPTSKVDSLFASYFFKLRHTVKLFEFYSFGITGDRLRLYYKDFAAIPTKFPTLKEQKRIAAILSAADTEIEVHQAILVQLQQQKRGLMQQLLSGKVRVNVDSRMVEG